MKSPFERLRPIARAVLRGLAVLAVHELPLWLVWMRQAHGGFWPDWQLLGAYFWIDLPVSFIITNRETDSAVIVASLFQWGGLEWLVLALLANAIWFKRWYFALAILYGIVLVACFMLFFFFVLPWLG